MVASGLAGATAAYMTIRTNGFNLSSVLSLGGLFQVGNSASAQRYSTAPHQAFLPSLLLMVTYVGALTAPRWLLCSAPSRFRRAKAALPILGATLYGAVSTARAAMVISAVLWAGSYLTSRSLLGRPVRLRMATVARIVIGVAAGIVLFLGIAYIRIGGPSAHGSQKVPTKVESYAFGYLPAFSAWQSSLETPSFVFVSQGERWGDLTFNGVTKLVIHNSIDDEPYPEFFTVDKQGDTTNIYTFFRGLIEDFGIFGAIFLMFLAGFIGTRSYETMNSYRTIGSYVTTTVITSSILFTNHLPSFFFTNICAAFLVDAVLIRILMTVHTAENRITRWPRPKGNGYDRYPHCRRELWHGSSCLEACRITYVAEGNLLALYPRRQRRQHRWTCAARQIADAGKSHPDRPPAHEPRILWGRQIWPKNLVRGRQGNPRMDDSVECRHMFRINVLSKICPR